MRERSRPTDDLGVSVGSLSLVVVSYPGLLPGKSLWKDGAVGNRNDEKEAQEHFSSYFFQREIWTVPAI